MVLLLVASVLDAHAGAPLLSLDWSVTGDELAAWVGLAVASAGDVNGDGYADIVLDAQPETGATEGSALVFYGSSTGLATTPSWEAPSVDGGEYLGGRGAAAGDVNGDGYGDLVVGAYDFDDGGDDGYTAYLYLGSPTGLDTVADWTATSASADEFNFAQRVASAGDVNGDGYDDVLVGSYSEDAPEKSEGKVFLYLGSASGLETAPSWSAESNQEYAFFGISLASAGDVNGDGYDDVIVGARDYDDPELNEGAAFVYLGSAGGLGKSAAWSVEGDQWNAGFGTSVSSAGDVNGDGYADVIVGGPLYDSGEGYASGTAFVFLGSASGLATTSAWSATSDEDANFGSCVASAGDVNADGYADVVVGAQSWGSGRGLASVFLGSSTGVDPTPAWTESGDAGDSIFGISVASAGDVDDDGSDEVLVGAWGYTIGKSGTGAYLYVGGVGSGPDTDADDDGVDDDKDCDDANPDVYPGATEVCGDGIDNDCDKSIDEDCADDSGTDDSGGGGDAGGAGDDDGGADDSSADDDDGGCGCGGTSRSGTSAFVALIAIAVLGRRSEIRSRG